MASKFAFPGSSDMSNGMTQRDYFAATALNGMLSHPGTKLEDNSGIRALAAFAYDIADAMLEARGTDDGKWKEYLDAQ
jgi:hypothetical protein